jgi:hypothetical protein
MAHAGGVRRAREACCRGIGMIAPALKRRRAARRPGATSFTRGGAAALPAAQASSSAEICRRPACFDA